MNTTTTMIHLVLSGVLIVGAYQFYFWCQRNMLFEPRVIASRFDERIPYVPQWVWIYSFLYYPAILLVNLVIHSSEQFTQVAISYLMLLAMQMAFFMVMPVRTPEHWRTVNGQRTPSERFLALVQRFDAATNSFPSMHTSVAMLTALHLQPEMGVAVFAFPVLIALSCLFTKQHYVIDLPAGALLGWLDYALYMKLVAS
jgi:membrane-associated phospholipid phosphatase